MKARKQLYVAAMVAVCSTGHCQIPDMLNALDAGSRSMGVGSSTTATDANTYAALSNPAALGYLQTPQLSVSLRNLPESTNTVTGNFDDLRFATSKEAGSRRITHVGYTMPIKHGVLGFSYTMGGYIRDERAGDGLPLGNQTVRNYSETLQAQTDFFTMSYGRARGSSNWGVGIVLANQYINNVQSYRLFDANQNLTGVVNAENSGNSYGVGLVAGMLFSPGNNSNTNVGISVRTPISLSTNDETSPYLKRLPGKASLGFASRSNAFGEGTDFLTYGAQVDWYFGGDKDGVFQRKDALAGGVGVEYNMHRFNARIPIRFGYHVVQDGGDGFEKRNTFTFGLGYRPNGKPFSVDLSFGSPGGGSLDTGISLTYRISN